MTLGPLVAKTLWQEASQAALAVASNKVKQSALMQNALFSRYPIDTAIIQTVRCSLSGTPY
ncbi:uncharacterized protein PHACADRAFT_260677 [Phanerochaete carnosa HHB-10118-sp]|uniref:Uncharacterized protein n=1 Tax=Phanerochaete carnosa (strain HHB-10118-sp) TaxID=650164 RepID=K5VZW9_PHACS|nr:uncharacterized protein PHACADRAFT_260677 [Phanerochaete carnosa HHB-10118-sp]EKM52360.1 hypothetical protein PHACADRAFT_260677 [Phanerochaete carnosa HHB-10118-sp]